MPQVHGTRRGLTVVAVAALLLGAFASAHAALTTPACLAKKLGAWANLRKCQAGENGKALQGKAADAGKCQTKFDAKLTAESDKATAAGVACRYGDNGDGTVTDYDTGLQWEKKTAGACTDALVLCLADTDCTAGTCVGPHYVNDRFSATFATLYYLDPLSPDGSTLTGPFVGFGGHSDWRLPNLMELQGIVDQSVAGCGTGGVCIDPIFGLTAGGTSAQAVGYMSSIVFGSKERLWYVDFGTGAIGFINTNLNPLYVRAVRSAL